VLEPMAPLPSLWPHPWDKQYKGRKGLFCIMVSEVSVPVGLAPLLLGLWWGCASQWEHVAWELQSSAYSSQEAERKERWCLKIPTGACTQCPPCLSVQPCPKVFPPPNSVICCGLSFNTWPLEMAKFQTITPLLAKNIPICLMIKTACSPSSGAF
jgi:hypothetical protein